MHKVHKCTVHKETLGWLKGHTDTSHMYSSLQYVFFYCTAVKCLLMCSWELSVGDLHVKLKQKYNPADMKSPSHCSGTTGLLVWEAEDL